MTLKDIFTTIRTEGALLPPDLLQRITDGDNIGGLTPESYHLFGGEKLNEKINYEWNRLQGAWQAFRTAQQHLSPDNIGTSLTRDKWLLPLFDSLGYGRLQTVPAVEIDGRSYPISHRWSDHVPIHLMSYKIDLDKRTSGIAGASTASPHSLLQVFLNRSDENLWGFVSNGYKLRILRDNASLTRQAYVEFDLEGMMDGEVYSDFVLLWLLGHQSRVEDPRNPWLEQWMKTAEEDGTRALEQLRVGVEEAITALGVGFLEHPSNAGLRDSLQSGDLDKQDYYRQLLRIVYRLLFLFVAEDRDLLLDPHAPPDARERYNKFYATHRLRRMAAAFKGTRHHDLFEGLRLVMRLLSGDSNGAGEGLGLVPLGSFLFSDEAVYDIIDCRISNTHFLDAIRALSLVYDERTRAYRSVDYKNLGSEELGSVYESLLELHPQINVPGRRFALATAGGHERRTTGSYYTPTSLVNALLDSALNPVLEEATQQGEAAILDLKICDPACGSGHFLIAAANRMAKALAFARTGEEEPSPADIQEAKRDIIGHCIYGVDINPMAVELCKVNLWMEALEPGKPLSFLDHRILVGNSLLGTTPKLMREGIPDDAFQPIEGDDRSAASLVRKQNKEERRGQMTLWETLADDPAADVAELARQMSELDALPDGTLDGILARERRYQDILMSPEHRRQKLLADAWCSAFVWVKKQQTTDDIPPLTQRIYQQLEQDSPFRQRTAIEAEVARLAERYQFFHWHVAFPDAFDVPPRGVPAENEVTGWKGGFDVVLGNPPWERIKIQEKEWFAGRHDEIASAPRASDRRKLIAQLADTDPNLLEEFLFDRRKAEGESHFLRNSNRYPLAGRGDINTYQVFAETSRDVINGYGRAGVIVPSGIATDDTTKFFFQNLMETYSLVSLLSFENEEFVFPSVHHAFKFCLFNLSGNKIRSDYAEFVFYARQVEHLSDEARRFTLSASDINLLNPNTGTTAIFRFKRDANISKSIYSTIPVLINENEKIDGNLWNMNFSHLFHMSNDAELFATADELLENGWNRKNGNFSKQDRLYISLYEARMLQHFDHRAASVGVDPDKTFRSAVTEETSLEDHVDPYHLAVPRYWLDKKEVEARLDQWRYNWVYGIRDITASTNTRTAIASIFGRVGSSGIYLLQPLNAEVAPVLALSANVASFIFDYCARQKVGGTHLSLNYLKQLPVIPPQTYIDELLDLIVPRVLELTYTAWDLQAFAQDVGWDGPPFIWDEERRFLMRCELDALYFHLYQIERDDVDYIMETFPIVKRKDIAATADENGENGEYITKRVILEMYDEMAALPFINVPHPKGLDEDYLVPDVSQFETWLNPPPADPSVAHEDMRGE